LIDLICFILKRLVLERISGCDHMTCPKRKQTDLQPNVHVLGDYGCGFEFCFKCHSSPQCGVTCRKPELAKQLVEKMRKERAERQQITFVRAKEWSEMEQEKQEQLAAKHEEDSKHEAMAMAGSKQNGEAKQKEEQREDPVPQPAVEVGEPENAVSPTNDATRDATATLEAFISTSDDDQDADRGQLVQLRQLQQKLFTLAQQLQQRLGAMGATNEMGQDTGADAGTNAGRSALADTGNSHSNSHNGLPLPELARKEDQMRIAAAALEKRQQEEETKPQETKQPEQKQQKQQEQKQTTQKPSKQEEREEEGEEREEKKEGETKTGDAQAETPTSGGGDLYEERLANERYEVELMKKKLQLEMARISQMSNTMQSMVGGDGMNMQHMPQMGDMSGTLSLLGWCHCLLLWPLVVVVAATIGVRLTS